jgi:hypothetical protein
MEAVAPPVKQPLDPKQQFKDIVLWNLRKKPDKPPQMNYFFTLINERTHALVPTNEKILKWFKETLLEYTTIDRSELTNPNDNATPLQLKKEYKGPNLRVRNGEMAPRISPFPVNPFRPIVDPDKSASSLARLASPTHLLTELEQMAISGMVAVGSQSASSSAVFSSPTYALTELASAAAAASASSSLLGSSQRYGRGMPPPFKFAGEMWSAAPFPQQT